MGQKKKSRNLLELQREWGTGNNLPTSAAAIRELEEERPKPERASVQKKYEMRWSEIEDDDTCWRDEMREAASSQFAKNDDELDSNWRTSNNRRSDDSKRILQEEEVNWRANMKAPRREDDEMETNWRIGSTSSMRGSINDAALRKERSIDEEPWRITKQFDKERNDRFRDGPIRGHDNISKGTNREMISNASQSREMIHLHEKQRDIERDQDKEYYRDIDYDRKEGNRNRDRDQVKERHIDVAWDRERDRVSESFLERNGEYEEGRFIERSMENQLKERKREKNIDYEIDRVINYREQQIRHDLERDEEKTRNGYAKEIKNSNCERINDLRGSRKQYMEPEKYIQNSEAMHLKYDGSDIMDHVQKKKGVINNRSEGKSDNEVCKMSEDGRWESINCYSSNRDIRSAKMNVNGRDTYTEVDGQDEQSPNYNDCKEIMKIPDLDGMNDAEWESKRTEHSREKKQYVCELYEQEECLNRRRSTDNDLYNRDTSEEISMNEKQRVFLRNVNRGINTSDASSEENNQSFCRGGKNHIRGNSDGDSLNYNTDIQHKNKTCNNLDSSSRSNIIKRNVDYRDERYSSNEISLENTLNLDSSCSRSRAQNKSERSRSSREISDIDQSHSRSISQTSERSIEFNRRHLSEIKDRDRSSSQKMYITENNSTNDLKSRNVISGNSRLCHNNDSAQYDSGDDYKENYLANNIKQNRDNTFRSGSNEKYWSESNHRSPSAQKMQNENKQTIRKENVYIRQGGSIRSGSSSSRSISPKVENEEIDIFKFRSNLRMPDVVSTDDKSNIQGAEYNNVTTNREQMDFPLQNLQKYSFDLTPEFLVESTSSAMRSPIKYKNDLKMSIPSTTNVNSMVVNDSSANRSSTTSSATSAVGQSSLAVSSSVKYIPPHLRLKLANEQKKMQEKKLTNRQSDSKQQKILNDEPNKSEIKGGSRNKRPETQRKIERNIRDEMLKFAILDKEKIREFIDIIEGIFLRSIDAFTDSVKEDVKNISGGQFIKSLVPSFICLCMFIRRLCFNWHPYYETCNSRDGDETQFMGGLADDFVQQQFNDFKPLFKFFVEESGVKLHKLYLLYESVEIVYLIGNPLMSDDSTLLESLWNAFYVTDFIEEPYFQFWFDDENDMTQARKNATFQVLHWYNWINKSSLMSEEAMDDELDREEESEEDVEMNVPKRIVLPTRKLKTLA